MRGSKIVGLEWMEVAKQQAATCWCTPETQNTLMDPNLCQEVAKKIASWMEIAAQAERGVTFYQNLLDECAKHLGEDAYRADDGVLHPDPLRLKIPLLVKELCRQET